MDKLQQAIQEELANRLKSGRIKSGKDLSNLFTEMYRMEVLSVVEGHICSLLPSSAQCFIQRYHRL
ncbi:hypothetical protein LX66_3609 [Chitinophaga japonensis]|uniref:Uncharacterized protein n=1 Tax=Chitinophaga japonensis TaxID=104662 RepID=A0A562SYV7_CHIJA|nr:hypothetical protein LX66_3609 [Chitinophaga japonensis]